MKQKENNYISPSVEVLEMVTENGFATSIPFNFDDPNWNGGFDGGEEKSYPDSNDALLTGTGQLHKKH